MRRYYHEQNIFVFLLGFSKHPFCCVNKLQLQAQTSKQKTDYNVQFLIFIIMSHFISAGMASLLDCLCVDRVH